MKVTITKGELFEYFEDLRDNTEIFADMGDLQMYEVRVHMVLPATSEHPAALILELGQVWNEERDIDQRIDERHRS